MYFNEEKERVVTKLNSDEKNGLTQFQANDLQKQYGYNELKEAKKDSIIKKFFLQFTDPLIIVLIIAALVSIIVDPKEWVDSLIILIVVVFNAVLGVYQENNAEKSLDALKKMAAPNAKVIRDGKKLVIPSKEIVVGDICVIEAGDYIPSDGRVIDSYNLQIDESALTGESVPVTKTSAIIDQLELALADQKNMVFASTVCTYGRGNIIVTSIGMDNEVGKIADMLMNEEKQITPLQIKLAQISKIIGYMCLGICAVVFGLEMLSGLSILEAFKTAVALAVAAIPEGLATVVTIVLALGVTKMVKKNAIVRKLPAVETLGSCSIICSDKTGTLTQNKMTVVKTYIDDLQIADFNIDSDPSIRTMLSYFTLCSDGEVKETNEGLKMLGDPTETALVHASYLFGDKKEDLEKTFKRIDEIAFDSSRKMMSVFFKTSEGIFQITKGAPDVIISRSNQDLTLASEANEKMANQALRVLALAVKYYPTMPDITNVNEIESNMTFVGMVGMIDPPRLEVKQAIKEAKSGGIKTIMITGDHLTTAKAIATELGIFNPDTDLAITGEELNKLQDEELKTKIRNITVYARVAPEHKVRIVNIWQSLGQVVAMTGDGVNDSPALKTADIGCAMGITGTDVSKNAADMILTDDNFATIISSVKEGRGIYANIKKDVQFLLSSNIGEVITIFGASLISLIPGFSIGVPLLPIHLLWVNLITDSLPAFAIGMEPTDPNIMSQKPRPKDESFFANGLGFTIAWQGLMIGIITLGSYMFGNNINHETGMTMAFVTLALSQLVHSFNVKSEKSILNKSLFSNKYLLGAFAVGVALQVLIINIPFLSSIFKLVPLYNNTLIVAVFMALIPLVVCEVVKFFKNK